MFWGHRTVTHRNNNGINRLNSRYGCGCRCWHLIIITKLLTILICYHHQCLGLAFLSHDSSSSRRSRGSSRRRVQSSPSWKSVPATNGLFLTPLLSSSSVPAGCCFGSSSSRSHRIDSRIQPKGRMRLPFPRRETTTRSKSSRNTLSSSSHCNSIARPLFMVPSNKINMDKFLERRHRLAKSFLKKLMSRLLTRITNFYQELRTRIVGNNATKTTTSTTSSNRSNTGGTTSTANTATTTTTTTTTTSTTEQEVQQQQQQQHNVIGGGTRWAVAANNVDLSGTWKPIVTPQFKQEYDQYLQNCSQSLFFRKAVLQGIAFQTEHIYQKDGGRQLTIVATNPVGNWERTLISSGLDTADDHWEPIHIDIVDPDGDQVQVEAWWENHGQTHKSWLRGKPRVHGGTFETTRYLDTNDSNILICESKFHPPPPQPTTTTTKVSSPKFLPGHVIWKFKRCDNK